MKKLALSTIVILLSFAASAKVVSLDEATLASQKYFRSIQAPSLVANSEELVGDGSSCVEAPAFYIFDNPQGGWVILSAENSVEPVLAYSKTGKFQTIGMPGNLKYILSGYRDHVRACRVHNLPQSNKVKTSWSTLGQPDPDRSRSAAPKVLTTATWGQGNPFNTLCPIIPGESDNSVVGCVATAMCIIMKYHSFPDKGRGEIPSYTYKTDRGASVTINGYSIEGKVYDYNLMPNSSHEYNTQEKITAVSELCHDAGVMVKMMYSSRGSGTYSDLVVNAMARFMRYSAEARLEYKSQYSDEEWMKKIDDEINANRPVYYSGSGSNGGHAFIVESVNQTEKKYKLNLGWYGQDNGWYTIDLSKVGSYDFPRNNDAIFGLEPDPTGKHGDVHGWLTLCYIEEAKEYGFGIKSGEIRKGSNAVLTIGTLKNQSSSDFNGTVKLCLENKLGEIVSDIKEGTDKLNVPIGQGVSYTAFPIEMKTDFNLTDNIVGFCKDIAAMQWTRFEENRTDVEFMHKLSVTDARLVLLDKEPKVGDMINLNLTLGQQRTKSISWKFNGNSVKESVTLGQGSNVITADIIYSDGDEETVTLTINL